MCDTVNLKIAGSNLRGSLLIRGLFILFFIVLYKDVFVLLSLLFSKLSFVSLSYICGPIFIVIQAIFTEI